MGVVYKEYQRNSTFIIMVFVCLTCFVYVTHKLVDVIVPLVWSAFFAVPLTALIANIENAITHYSSLLWWSCRGDRTRSQVDPVAFKVSGDENCIRVDRTAVAKAFLEKLEHPCDTSCPCGAWCCFGLGFMAPVRSRLRSCFECRIRIIDLTVGGKQVDDAPEVNRLVKDWSYYVTTVDTEPAEEIRLELYLDQDGLYPAVVSGMTVQSSEQYEGVMEIDRKSTVSWFVSFLSAMGCMVVMLGIFAFCMSSGISALKHNLKAYETGAQEAVESATAALTKLLPNSTTVDFQDQATEFVKTAIPELATTLAAHFEYMGFQTVLFIIYMLFWLCEPLPVNNAVAQVVKNYLLLKTIVCLLFASLMSGLLYWLDCPLWHIFFVVSFLLNYIPEIGFMAAFALMIPATLFDGHHTASERRNNTALLLVFGMLFKVITGNIIEVQMYATRGGQYMRMHPVVLMALMMFCEALLGITGMFLAIPIVAAVKYYMVTADMPMAYLNPMLLLIEGDEAGPHKNYVDRHRAGYGSMGTLSSTQISDGVHTEKTPAGAAPAQALDAPPSVSDSV